MKIKLKLGVVEDKWNLTVEPNELGYTEEQWDYMTDEERQRVLITFVNNLTEQPYWYLESFKTL